MAFFLNLGFTIIEIIGGILTNSLAIISDALHDLGDSLSLGLAWYFQNLSKKGQDKKFSYGYKRFSILGALINSVILIIGSVIIVTRAIPRLIEPQQANAEGMLYLSILGIVINGIAALRMKDGSTLNEKVVSLHLLEDVLGWVAVLIVSIIMKFYDIPILDPILSLVIALFILFNVYKSLSEAVKIILQTTPPEIDLNEIRNLILNINEVEDIHDLHIWSMDGASHIISLHIIPNKNLQSLQDSYKLKEKVRKELEKNELMHATIEIEDKNNLSNLQGH